MLRTGQNPTGELDSFALEGLIILCCNAERYFYSLARSIDDYTIRRLVTEVAQSHHVICQKTLKMLNKPYSKNEITAYANDKTPSQCPLNNWYIDALKAEYHPKMDKHSLKNLLSLQKRQMQKLIEWVHSAQVNDTQKKLADVAVQYRFCIDALTAVIERLDPQA